LKPVFAKVSTLHAKNCFTFAIVAGNLFAEDDDDTVSELLDGTIKIPLPTYFTVGTTPLPQRIINKIEKDEEVHTKQAGLHFVDRLTGITDLPKPTLSWKAKYDEYIRGVQNRRTRRLFG
jgi:hypothetical protein